VHPYVRIQRISKNSIILIGGNETLTIEYFGELRKNTRWVSMKMLKKTPIEQLEFIGNPIKLSIKLSNIVEDLKFTKKFSSYYNQRSIIAKHLSKQYSRTGILRVGYIKIFLTLRALIFSVFLISFLCLRKESLRFSSVLLLTAISAILIIDLLSKGTFLLKTSLFLRSIIAF
jgi:hypothetical protein